VSKRLIIVRLGSLGDLIHTLPAVAAFLRVYPDARIDWLVEAPHRDLLDLVPILSSVIVMKGRSLGGWLETSRELKGSGYDVAFDFQGLIKSAALARFSGAASVVGFNRRALREPLARLFYTNTPIVGEGRHVIDKNLALMSAFLETTETLQSSPAERALMNFPMRRIESAALDRVRQQASGAFALVNPGAAWPNKRWPADRFGAVARVLREAHGLTPIVLWGPAEQSLAQSVVDASGGAAVIAPETQLPDLVALSRAASFMISGDTGPLHSACAAGVPTVSLFGPTDAKRNGPWDTRDIMLTRYDRCACHYKRQCHQPDSWCLADISVDDVRNAIRTRLAAA
jgi:lipopolysaccharide heptosyltransferase I